MTDRTNAAANAAAAQDNPARHRLTAPRRRHWSGVDLDRFHPWSRHGRISGGTRCEKALVGWLTMQQSIPDEQATGALSTAWVGVESVTAMSPLEFQKQLRLQEARRLMLGDGFDASSAGYRVGYNDVSHFTREYKRLFGEPPMRDVVRMRGVVMESASL
jgi:hypothetical protein